MYHDVPCTIMNNVFQHHVSTMYQPFMSTMYQPFMARASRPWRRHPGPSAPLWSRRWHCWQGSVQRPGGQRSMDWWDNWQENLIPSGKHTKNYGKSLFLMGKSTISMAIFNSYVSLPEGISWENRWFPIKVFPNSTNPLKRWGEKQWFLGISVGRLWFKHQKEGVQMN